MIDTLNRVFLFNLFDTVPPIFSYLICCIGAIFCGTVVGKEREKAQKAAGLRTFAMVALGSCVFTITSRLVMSEGFFTDGARIPAQIVTGVGFLGAGAVFREGRIVSGLTTAAGIWSTAAVGLVFGLGFFTFGFCITFMIFVLFQIHSFVDKKNMDVIEWVNYHVHVDSKDGKGVILVEDIFRDWGHEPQVVEVNDHISTAVWNVKLTTKLRSHQRFLTELATHPYVLRLIKH
jgi:putative Mg2+ transporter-C (MgtC) family protein